MSFPQSTIVELKENNAIWHGNITDINGITKTQNGNFDVMLNKAIPINDGDQISIKSLYIDSVAASSEKIVLEQDLQLDLSCVNYIQNIDTTSRSYNDSIWPSIPVNQPDGKAYFACTKSQTLDVNNTLMVGQITIYQHLPNKPWGRDGLFLKMLYTDLSGRNVFMNLPIPYNSGNLKTYVYNNTTHPNIFTMYCDGTVATIKTNIQTANHTIFKDSDNVNTTSIISASETGLNPFYKYLANATTFKSLTGVTISAVVTDEGDFMGGSEFHFSALSWKTGLPFNGTFNIPKVQVGGNPTQNITGEANGFIDLFMCIPVSGDTAFTQTFPSHDVTRDTLNMRDIIASHLQLGPVNFATSFMYRQNNVTITMDAGNYTIEEICESLTDKLTNISVSGFSNFSNYPVNSPFLHTNNQLKELNDIASPEVQYYCSEDGDSYFSAVDGTGDFWVGSDQISFIGDPVINKAKISSIHSNIYDSTPNISTKFINNFLFET